MKLRLSALILLFLLFFALPGRTYFEIRGRAQRLERLQTEVETLRGRQAELGEELAYRQSPFYIEKEAREQLNYVGENEIIIILPDFEENGENGDDQESAVSSENLYSRGRAVSPWQANAKRWWRLLFLGD